MLQLKLERVKRSSQASRLSKMIYPRLVVCFHFLSKPVSILTEPELIGRTCPYSWVLLLGCVCYQPATGWQSWHQFAPSSVKTGFVLMMMIGSECYPVWKKVLLVG